jgi:hypothetical protein
MEESLQRGGRAGRAVVAEHEAPQHPHGSLRRIGPMCQVLDTGAPEHTGGGRVDEPSRLRGPCLGWVQQRRRQTERGAVVVPRVQSQVGSEVVLRAVGITLVDGLRL